MVYNPPVFQGWCGYFQVLGILSGMAHAWPFCKYFSFDNALVWSSARPPMIFRGCPRCWLVLPAINGARICLPLAILSGVLSIIHLPLYNAGHLAMEHLTDWATGHDPGMLVALSHWSTVFTNILLLVNWSTPLHRDPHSQADWYDMLVSVGNYDDCALDIPSLGIQVLYNPSTVVAFSPAVSAQHQQGWWSEVLFGILYEG